jgi:hypothetical protein
METLFHVKSAGICFALRKCFDSKRESRELWGNCYGCVMRVEGADDIENFRVNMCIQESFFEVKVAAFQPSCAFLWPLYPCFIKL